MGTFDRFWQAFRGDQSPMIDDRQTEQAASSKTPEVSLSPLPKSIRGMPKGQHIDRMGMMHATDIGFGQGYGPEQKDFWAYKEQHNGHSKADYLEMGSHIPEIRDRLNAGESLESLIHDDRLGACATQYFSPDNMIRVESFPDGHYEFSSGGRHRIAAAQELGIEIPVQINELGNKDGYSISPWEKQERFDALTDHMRERGYSETDSMAYEADPEWQRLHREYDHPINAWETDAGVDWETGGPDAMSKTHFEDSPSAPDRTASDVSEDAAFTAYKNDRRMTSYTDRIQQTPSLESQRWAGDRGESLCAPSSDDAKKILQERGVSGVQYTDGIPDFSPFSESTVKLGYMTDARHSRDLIAGHRDGKDTLYATLDNGETVSESHYAGKDSMADLHLKYSKPGNFEQADILTAKQWTADGRDDREWTAEDVAQYRQDHGLTWHECNDMETMQLIPKAINTDFGHLGGVGEVKEMQRVVAETKQEYDEGQMVEAEDYDAMTPEELEAAARENGHYTEEGVWVPEGTPGGPVDDQPVEAPDAPDDPLEQATQELEEAMPEDAAADAEPEEPEQIVDQLEDSIPAEDMDRVEQATRELEEAMPEDASADAVPEEPEQIVDQLEDSIPAEDMDRVEQATQELEETMPEEQTEEEIVSESIDQPTEEAAEQVVETASQEDAETEFEDQADEEVYTDLADEESAESDMDAEDYSDPGDEESAESSLDAEDYSDLMDEEALESDLDAEDYSDLADVPAETLSDSFGYEDLADEQVEEPSDAAEYSDLADDVDNGTYEDASIDSSEALFDSGDTGSFDDGGGSAM